jgi:hypothetical protein
VLIILLIGYILWKPFPLERELGIAMEFENENDNLFFGLAFNDGEFRHCSAATTR